MGGRRGVPGTLLSQRELVSACLMDRPQSKTSCPIMLTALELVRASFTSPSMQQVTLNTGQTCQHSESSPTSV